MPAGRKKTTLALRKEVRFLRQSLKKAIMTLITNTVLARRGDKTWHGTEGHVLLPTQSAGSLNELAANRKGGTKDVRSGAAREKTLSL